MVAPDNVEPAALGRVFVGTYKNQNPSEGAGSTL